jgi:DNA-binding response OmpR family regulator
MERQVSAAEPAGAEIAVAAPGVPGRPRSGLRALVVEDEVQLAAVVGSYFERDGFEVRIVHDGPGAVTAAREVDPDVIVLDLGLPGLDGTEVCREVRTFSDAYVVILTARSDEIDTLIGLSVGADDYVTKPFSPRELMARVQAMLRRPRSPHRPDPDPGTGSSAAGGAGPAGDADTRTFGDLQVDVVGRDVWLDRELVALTRTEFDLLAALTERPRMAFTRRQLIDRVWGEAWVGDEHLVDVHIGHLRRKLGDDAAAPRYIRTVRGVGYRMGTGQ